MTAKRQMLHPSSKKGQKDDTRNYKLVGSTSVPGKIMEQYLLGSIYGHMRRRRLETVTMD